MGIFDRARDATQEHADKIDPLADRLADGAGKRSGGQHGATTDADLAQQEPGGRRETTPEPGTPA
jgi:hypothetical protein